MRKVLNQLKRVAWIRHIYHGGMRLSAEVLGSSVAFGLLISVISIPTFFREQFSIVRGKRNYYRSIRSATRSHTGLRRNIHRLEKGLIMKPRRAVFAGTYLMETMEFYEQALSVTSDIGPVNAGELAWAHDVLSEYFAVTDRTHPLIAQAKQRFDACPHASVDCAPLKPFARGTSVCSDVTYDGLLALARQRRSVRWFLPACVPRDAVDQALMVARQSPTACNRLPYEFRIFDEPNLVRRIVSIPMGARTFAEQIPAVAVVVGKQRHFFSPRDRHVIYVDASLAAMGFLYALETLGLASTVINWPDLPRLERKMQRTLHLDWDERVVMLIAFGYPDPDAMVPFSEKKPVDLLRSWNDLGGP